MDDLRRAESAAIGAKLDARVVGIINRAIAERSPRRAQWDNAVKSALVDWRENFGYKRGPMIDLRMVQREVRAMIFKVIEGRLLKLTAPVFVTAEYIEQSCQIVGILASPSNNGPERYAPKSDGVERISVQ